MDIDKQMSNVTHLNSPVWGDLELNNFTYHSRVGAIINLVEDNINGLILIKYTTY